MKTQIQFQVIALSLLLLGSNVAAQNYFLDTWTIPTANSNPVAPSADCCYYSNVADPDLTVSAGSSATAATATGTSDGTAAGCAAYTSVTGTTGGNFAQTLTLPSATSLTASSGSGTTASSFTLASDQVTLTFVPTRAAGSSATCSQVLTRVTAPITTLAAAGTPSVWDLSQSNGASTCCFISGSLTFTTTSTTKTVASGTKSSACGATYSQVLKAGSSGVTATDLLGVEKFTVNAAANTLTYEPSSGCTQVFAKSTAYSIPTSTALPATWPISQSSGTSCCFISGSLAITTATVASTSVIKAAGTKSSATGTTCVGTAYEDILKLGSGTVSANDLSGTKKFTVSTSGNTLTFEPSAGCVQTFVKTAPAITGLAGTWPSTSTDGTSASCCFITGDLTIASSGAPAATGTKSGTPCVGTAYSTTLIAGTSPITATDLTGVETFTLSGDGNTLTYKPSASCTQVFTKSSTSDATHLMPPLVATGALLGLLVV